MLRKKKCRENRMQGEKNGGRKKAGRKEWREKKKQGEKNVGRK